MADDDPVILTAGFVARLRAALRWVDGFSVTGAAAVTRTPDSLTIHVPPQPRAVPAAARVGSDVTVKILEAHTGGGKYAGQILQPRTGGDVALTGNLAEADIGSTTDAVACIVLNAQEAGTSGHWLTNGSNTLQRVFNGRITSVNASGMPVVTINGLWAKSC